MSNNNNIWVWVEQRNGKLMDVSLQTLGKGIELAKVLDGKVEAVLIGDNVEGLAKEITCYGADKVYMVSDPALELYQSRAYTRIISELIAQHKPDILLMGASNVGVDLAPAVAARVKTGLTAHCSDLQIETIDGKPRLVATIPGFSGGMIVKIAWNETKPWMATVSSGVAEKPVFDENKQGSVVKVDYEAKNNDFQVQTIEMVEKEPASMPVEGASVVVSAGKGIKSKEEFKLIQDLAEALGAAIGGTRPARDAEWVTNDNLIGASGKTISPKLFISIGASGAAHYTAGFMKAKYIIALDKDPSAPIFDTCDLGIQADLNEVLPRLLELLKTS